MRFSTVDANIARRTGDALATGVLLAGLAACVATGPTGQPSALDGKWLGSYVSNTPGPLTNPCNDGYGGIVIRNGIVSGEASNPTGPSYQISGKVLEGTRIQASFVYQGRKLGALYGALTGDHLEGNFTGIGNCMGTWTAIRQ